ncbi:MAG TPA: T9SS type B sorting domain-containing protein [Flavobacteriaceae bacterium]|nr:T9SS type B sorting domain-containing protein [Flavobacteriaceae bacterium]
MKRNSFIATICIFIHFICFNTNAQDIELFAQVNGPYDFTAIGNTMNLSENNLGGPCVILDTSSAELNIQNYDNIVAAYLYWAGSGIEDSQVSLNGTVITAERSFSYEYGTSNPLLFYGAFADVTNFVAANGNGTYELSGFDIYANLEDYCQSGLNFGGWSIIVIYQINGLPLSQINIYDGFETISAESQYLDIEITNLSLSEVTGAKIGFLAWEGDESLAVNETLSLNGDLLSNPPLNPAENAFNSTNSYTNSGELYNMDLDLYIIEDYVQVGDTDANVSITSGQDLIFMHNIITMMRSELPDATIEITNFEFNSCTPREIIVDYIVSNVNSTAELPQNTPITFYANDVVIQTITTQTEIPIGGSENGTVLLQIPNDAEDVFNLIVRVDDIGDGTGIIYEINEENNTDMIANIEFLNVNTVEVFDIIRCQIPGAPEYFNLNEALPEINSMVSVSFFNTLNDAENNTNAITNITTYTSEETAETIYVRFGNEPCFVIDSFIVEAIPVFQVSLNAISIDFEVSGDYGNQTITIQNLANGEYVYALDEIDGEYQENPVFPNLPGGIYTIYVVDLENCGYISFRVHLIEFMLFFTPNNDGYHDYWQIIGWDDDDVSLKDVFIFNRFGNLVHKLDLNSPGWDGTYKGNPLPSSDYWFKAVFSDGSVFRGHFTMKR